MNTILKSTSFSGLQRGHGSIFIWFAVVASQSCEIPRNSPKIRTYSSSRSSKVIDRGVNRKRMRICNFLLVINSSFGRISYRLLTFKARRWLVFLSLPSPLLDANDCGNPLEFLDEIYPAKTKGMGYRMVKK